MRTPHLPLKKIRMFLWSTLAMAAMAATAGQAYAEMAEGEVRRLDTANAKVTIRHGEIKRLDMPPMTMVFVAKPASILSNLSVGDKILFTAIEEGSQYVVTKIEKVKGQ